MKELKSFRDAANTLSLALASDKCGIDLHCIYNTLLEAGLDDRCLGFWVLDFQKNIEVYSPSFRATLGFEDEIDFPNHPDTWKRCINKEGLDLAMENLDKHFKTRGHHPYFQKVVYNTKQGGKVELICDGRVMFWSDNDEPILMVGLHT